MISITYVVGAELPDISFTWKDSSGAVIDFSSGWTFSFRINTDTPFIKTMGITGFATIPNVVVSFTANELDTLIPGIFAGQLWARRSSDSKDRNPILFRFKVEAAI